MAQTKILIVEDEGIVAKDLEVMLTGMGYKVLGVVTTGEAVLEKVRKLKPNLILMDIVLKGTIDGIEATRLVRSHFDIPVIYVTAYGDEEKIKRAKTTAPYGYILKPFSERVLKADIEMALYNHKIVDELKVSAKKLKLSLEEKEVLLKEVHHRVKNNMQIISSLLNLQSRRTKHKGTLSLFTESQARIQSMMLIHENLYESRNFSDIEFSIYIKKLVEHLTGLYKINTADIGFVVDVKKVRLDMNHAIPCGLVLNELITNSLKYAFPRSKSNRKSKGVIKISMRYAGDRIVLEMSDNGVGIPAGIDINNPSTLGLDLVKTLIRQMGANIKLNRRNGTAFTISFSKHEKSQ